MTADDRPRKTVKRGFGETVKRRKTELQNDRTKRTTEQRAKGANRKGEKDPKRFYY
jgi:hypothetical protein